MRLGDYTNYVAGSDRELESAIELIMSQGATREDFEEIARVCAALVTVKNKRYGDLNLTKRGIGGINYRIEDKLARIESAEKIDTGGSYEIIVQAYFDIAGYCINAIRLLVEGKI